jgi:hypothetical protein
VELTLDQLRQSQLVTGFGGRHWDAAWRLMLVDNLAVRAAQLAQAGITELYIDGSFCTKKDHPNDIDAYFTVDCERFLSGSLQDELNALDPGCCWTWDYNDGPQKRFNGVRQLKMRHQSRVRSLSGLRLRDAVRCGNADLTGVPPPPG